jgi:putative FmdB family regulatory protein
LSHDFISRNIMFSHIISAMPIFEYRCPSCSSKFEKIVYGQELTPACPKCGEAQVEKLLSSFAVHAEHARPPKGESCPCPCGAAERGQCQMMS